MKIYYLYKKDDGIMEYSEFPVINRKEEIKSFLSTLVEDDRISLKSMVKSFKEKYIERYHRTGYVYGIEEGYYTWYDRYGKEHEEHYSFSRDIGTVSYSRIQRGAIIPNQRGADELSWLFPKKKRPQLTTDEIRELKQQYADSIINSIQATNYELALKELKHSVDIVAFSHSFRGYNKIFYKKISDNVEISLDSNFGYGRASYFQMVVSYKGITILPYDRLFWYRYVKSYRLTQATDVFRCADEAWTEAFHRILYYYELIQAGESHFFNHVVVASIRKMVVNLNMLVNDPVALLKSIDDPEGAERMKLYDYKIDNHIRTNLYSATTKEIVQSIVFEKLATSIGFINSIEELSSLEKDLSEYIIEIRKIASTQIKPLMNLIENVSNDITNKEKHLQDEKRALSELTGDNNPNSRAPFSKQLYTQKSLIKQETELLEKRKSFQKLITGYLSVIQAVDKG